MDNSDLMTLPHVSFQPNSFTFYSRIIHKNSGEYYHHNRHILTKNNSTNGKVSNNARRKLNKAFNWLVYFSKQKSIYCKTQKKRISFKLNFITLTLSSTQIHSDTVIKKKLLNNFLTVIRTKYKCNHYIWKAEKQKNGNIHFHLITGTYIHYKKLQDEWNRIQNTLGYIDRFESKYNHTNPHSTEIKAVKNINKLSIYVAKYFTKCQSSKIEKDIINKVYNDNSSLVGTSQLANIIKDEVDKMKVEGRLWYASKGLLNPPSLSLTYADIDFDKIYKYLSLNKVRTFTTDYTTTHFLPIGRLILSGMKELGNMFNNMVLEHYNKLQLPDIPPPPIKFL